MTTNLAQLKNPFDPADIGFRAGATTQDKTRALALPYIDSRAVMDRLDAVVGPENWQDSYTAGPQGGVLCSISIRIDGEWVTKRDGADNTQYEAIKGGLSDAFKRAAVKWGIGRYLYSLPAVWVSCEQRGKSVIIDEGEARNKLFGSQPKNDSDTRNQPAKKGNGHSPERKATQNGNGKAPQNGSNGTDRQAYKERIEALHLEAELLDHPITVNEEMLRNGTIQQLTVYGKKLAREVEAIKKRTDQPY